MTDKLDRKLVYYTDEADNMLFAPKALAEEAFALREVLPACATWGDVRAALTDEQFARVSEGFIHPREFEAEKPVGGELDDWPVIYYHQIADASSGSARGLRPSISGGHCQSGARRFRVGHG